MLASKLTGTSRTGAYWTAFRHQLQRPFARSATKAEIFDIESTADFEKNVKRSKTPVIVDFTASWCNPCKKLTPRIESIVGEKNGAIKLAKVDIDEHCDLAMSYDVGSVPVLMMMKDGVVVERMVGLQEMDKIREFVERSTDLSQKQKRGQN